MPALAIVSELPAQDPVPVADDQLGAALMARRGAAFRVVHVTRVDVAQAVLQGDRAGTRERGGRRVRLVHHLPVGVNCGEVQRHVGAVSIACSWTTTGSLYVNAMLLQPSALATRASFSGLAASASVSISRDLEMSQFWQFLHARLQPAVPNDRIGVPGR